MMIAISNFRFSDRFYACLGLLLVVVFSDGGRLLAQPEKSDQPNEASTSADDPMATILAEADNAEAEGRRLYAEKKLEPALAAFRKASTVREGFLNDHRKTAVSALLIGQTLQALGKHQEAVTAFDRAAAVYEKVLGVESVQQAEVLVHAGYSYRLLNRSDDAKKAYLRALEIRRKKLGQSHLQTADVQNFLGVLHYGNGEYQTAAEYFSAAAHARSGQLGLMNLDTAQSQLNLGKARQSLGKPNDAVTPLENAVAAYRKLVVPDDSRTADALHWLGLAQGQIGRLGEAVRLSQEAFGIRDRLYGLQNVGTLTSLNNLADFLGEAGRLEESLERRRQAYEGYVKLLGADNELTLSCLAGLATTERKLGLRDQAEKSLRSLIDIHTQKSGAESPAVARIMTLLSGVKIDRAQHDEARRLLEQSVRILERTQGSDALELNDPLNSLGVLYQTTGNNDDAAEAFERSIRVLEKHGHTTSLPFAARLKNLGIVRVRQSRFAEAEELLRRAGRILEAGKLADNPAMAQVYSGFDLLYSALGDLRESERYAREALRIYETAYGPEHPETATGLNNVATALTYRRQYDEAEPLLRRSLAIREKSLGNEHPDVARAHSNLGGLQVRLKHDEEAIEHLTIALKIFEKIFGPEHPEVAKTLSQLADVVGRQSRFTDAEALWRRALDVGKKTSGDDLSFSDTLNGFAIDLIRQNKSDEAAQIVDDQQAATRRYVLRVLPELSSSEQIRILQDRIIPKLHRGLSYAADRNDQVDWVDKAAGWWINGKSTAQESLAYHNSLMREATNDVQKRNVRNLLNVRRELAASTMLIAEPSYRSNQLRRLQELVGMERDGIKLIGGKQTLTARDEQWIAVQQVKHAMSSKAVLIDIARFDKFLPNITDPTQAWGPAEYHAFVTFRDSDRPTRMIRLGDAAEIDGLVRRVREAVNAAAGSNGSAVQVGEEASSQQVREVFVLLAERIWKPIADHLVGIEEIILSPDGMLWLLPWNALPIEKGQEKYLIENYALRYIVSPRDLTKTAPKQPSSTSLLVADPLFETPEDTQRVQADRERFEAAEQFVKNLPDHDPHRIPLLRGHHAESLLPEATPLPATAVEAAAVKPNLEKYVQGNAFVYRQAEATESKVKQAIGPRVLALATHGFFLSEETRTKDDPADADVSRDAWGKMKPMSGNPLLHCGLLFNGCNTKRLVQYEDDGVLTGLEIIGMDLRGTELVVLSACETGLGTVNNGEGVAGLRQAFQLAGAQSGVSTLWQVPDRDSALLMSGFFDRLAQGDSKSEALRLAQIERIHKRRERYGAAHPYFWAAYTLTGR